MRLRLVPLGLVVGLVLLATASAGAQSALAPPTTGGLVAIDRLQKQRGQHKRVLIIGAHPDDEDTELLAWLARGGGAQAAYLSVNRGEGGQNSIGGELGDALGLLRSEELLAAREVDGARQFFTRAYDFGFSKSLDDTWAQWPRDTVLKDLVRVVRAFRPQVIVSVFTGTPRDGHGQHQAAGVLAREAFRMAGDPTAFPELQRDEGLAPFAPRKLFRSTRFDTAATTLVIDGGTIDPADGRTYHQLAMASRSRHRSQDMGQLQTIGASSIRLALVDDRTAGAAPDASLFSGIDTTLVAADVTDLVRAEQQDLADRVEAAERGLLLDAVADLATLVVGDSTIVTITLAGLEADASAAFTLRTLAGLDATPLGTSISTRGARQQQFVVRVREASAGQPYFLRRPREGAMYRWPTPDAAPLGQPFDAAPITAVVQVTRGTGRPLVLTRDATARENRRAGGGEVRAPLSVVPRVSVDPGLDAIVRPIGAPVGPLAVTVRNLGRAPWRGRIRLVRDDASSGASQAVLLAPGQDTVMQLALVEAAGNADARYTAQAVDDEGRIEAHALRELAFGHVARRSWLVPATVLVRRGLVIAPTRPIGYVRGPSDAVPEALRAAGIAVRELAAADLLRGRFEEIGSIVIGPRAYETRPELPDAADALRTFAARGGTVLVQYQWPEFAANMLFPAPITMARDRVTDERAAITVLDAAAPELTTPHRLDAADWNGWVQERGLQFLRSWDPSWRAPLELHDEGDTARTGALVVAPVGKGRLIYTGLSFFRQLPAGNAGALRAFLNLARGTP